MCQPRRLRDASSSRRCQSATVARVAVLLTGPGSCDTSAVRACLAHWLHALGLARVRTSGRVAVCERHRSAVRGAADDSRHGAGPSRSRSASAPSPMRVHGRDSATTCRSRHAASSIAGSRSCYGARSLGRSNRAKRPAPTRGHTSGRRSRGSRFAQRTERSPRQESPHGHGFERGPNRALREPRRE